MTEEMRHQLYRELRHLQSRLSASPLGPQLDWMEQRWSAGREALRRSSWALALGVDALREDLRELVQLGGTRSPSVAEPRSSAPPRTQRASVSSPATRSFAKKASSARPKRPAPPSSTSRSPG